MSVRREFFLVRVDRSTSTVFKTLIETGRSRNRCESSCRLEQV